MRYVHMLFALFAAVILSGCAQVAGGLMYKDTVGEKLDFTYAKESITPGVTTMAEVRSKIGDPYRDIQNEDGSTTWQYRRIVPKGFIDSLVAETRGKSIYDTTDQTHVTIVFLGNAVKFVSGKEYKDGKETNFKKGELGNAMVGPNGEIIPMMVQPSASQPPAQAAPAAAQPAAADTREASAPAPATAVKPAKVRPVPKNPAKKQI